MTYTDDDGESGNYYLPCGCWSGQSDHTCRVGGFTRPAGCHCGAPDDCYCHESCSRNAPEESCAEHRAEYAAELEEEHAEAIAEDIRRFPGWSSADARIERDRAHGEAIAEHTFRERDARINREDDAVTRLTSGRRPRVIRVQAYRADGSVHVLTNGMTYTDIRPSAVLGGNSRLAAVRLARLVLSAVPDISSVQIWDASSGTNVWGIGQSDSGSWFVAYPNRGRDGDPSNITDVRDMSDVDGSGGRS